MQIHRYIYSLRFHRFHDDSCSSLSVKSKRDARLCERDHLYLSSVSLLTYERSSHPRVRRHLNRSGFVIGSRLHFSAHTDTSSHFSTIGHTREIYVYFASNYERIVASVARSQYLVSVFDWTLCHMARPSQRVVVVLYCVVLCVVSLVSPLVPFRFPRCCNVKISLKVGEW